MPWPRPTSPQPWVHLGLLTLLSSVTAAQAAGCVPQMQWRSVAVQAALKYNIDPPLMLAMVTQESQWCPGARSPAGALGLGQLMPGTARDMGVTDPFDPLQNLYGSARYLRLQLTRFGRVDLALAAYNAGPERVKQYGGIPPITETQQHVQQVLGYYAAFKTAATPAPVQVARPGPILPPAPRPIYAANAQPAAAQSGGGGAVAPAPAVNSKAKVVAVRPTAALPVRAAPAPVSAPSAAPAAVARSAPARPAQTPATLPLTPAVLARPEAQATLSIQMPVLPQADATGRTESTSGLTVITRNSSAGVGPASGLTVIRARR